MHCVESDETASPQLCLYLGVKLEGNGPVEPAASRAIEDKHAVHVQ